MAFRQPWETPRQIAMRQRVDRANSENAEREKKNRISIEHAINHKRLIDETDEWIKQMQFNLYTLAIGITCRLEEQRNANKPTNENWNDSFCQAIELIPEARMFAEDCIMNCMKEKHE